MSRDSKGRVRHPQGVSLFRRGIEVRVRIFKDFWSTVTHAAGLVAAVVGFVTLLILCEPAVGRVTAACIYGFSLIALFGASTLYHFLDLGEVGNRWLQRLDHIGIYLLIAGSFVPAAVVLLDGAWRATILAVIGAWAAGGVALKLFWMDCPERLSTALYVAFGWFGVVPIIKAFPHLSAGDLALIIGGGLAYTLGAVIFTKEWPNPWPERFGHHEIWHLFVLAGATCHWVWILGVLTTPAYAG